MRIFEQIEKITTNDSRVILLQDALRHVCILAKNGDQKGAESALNEFLHAFDRKSAAEHVRILLEVAIFIGSKFVASKILTERSGVLGRIVISFNDQITQPFIIVLRKTSLNHVELILSDKIQEFEDLPAQVAWLLYMAPLLAKIASSPKVGVGQAFLNPWDAGVVSGLTFCGNRPDFFLLPDNVFLPSRGYQDLKRQLEQTRTPWEQSRGIAFWRGATTGQIPPGQDWRALQRVRLCMMAKQLPELLDAGLTKIVQLPPPVADELRQQGVMREYFPSANLHMFKYLIDVDGNTNAWGGLFERLLSGSAILKVESQLNYQQWYYDRLKPWEHYVPVARDLSDLRARIQWLRTHDDQARQIGENARALGYAIEYEAELERAMETVAAAFRAHSAILQQAKARIGASQQVVFTCHGSVVCFNRKSGWLVHAPVEEVIADTAYLPLTLERRAEGALLRTADGQYVTRIRNDGAAALTSSPPAGRESYFMMFDGHQPSRPGSHALAISGNFACADNGKVITFSRRVISTWESFKTGTMDALLSE